MSLRPSCAFLGTSHSPLLGVATLEAPVEASLRDALARMKSQVLAFDPELIVLVAPDHFNGFFHEVMPPFCIGTQATAVGDYRSLAGPLNVDPEAALGLAGFLIRRQFDIAVSRRMRVDHGFSQVLELIWGSLDTPPVLPVFLNAVAGPAVPTLKRCMDLGRAIGQWRESQPRRILFIGSGGLSHQPPLPPVDHPDPAVRERVMAYREPTPKDREMRMAGAMAAGQALAAGEGGMKPLNPAWDQDWLARMEAGDFCALTDSFEADITAVAGLAAHESKTWLVTRCALPDTGVQRCTLRHYQAIPELIAGFGLMFIESLPALAGEGAS